jgi:hypothetical protein
MGSFPRFADPLLWNVGVRLAPTAAIGRFAHALVGLVDTGRGPNDVDLAALTHSPTTFVHNLGSRLRCVKFSKVGIHLG